jgi:GNAT superfamily N-acetyltransferase
MTTQFRFATELDIPRIVELLVDDPLGATRESPDQPLAYRAAFEAISSDPNNELVVAVDSEEVVGVFQLTFIPYLTHKGSWRMLIEGVRVARSTRAQGVGHTMIEWAIDRARQRNCRIVQLTTDKSRPDALRFYESLGFKATHEGMKLQL